MLRIISMENTESLTTDNNHTGGLTGGAHYSTVLLRMAVLYGRTSHPHTFHQVYLFISHTYLQSRL